MQFTRVLYRMLMRATALSFLALLLFVNSFIAIMAKEQQESALWAQKVYLEQTLYLLNVDEMHPVSPIILGWRKLDANKEIVQGNRFASSWNMTESEFDIEGGKLVLTHKTRLASHFWHFAMTNLFMVTILLLCVGWSHHRIYKHWRVLIQLEAWASRFSRNPKFRFYIKTKDYHLVNTIRAINSQRIEAQKAGQKIDHFIRSQTFLDKNTDLGNRLYFEHRLESVLHQDDKVYGAVMIIQYAVLDTVRDAEGKDAAINLLKQFADILRDYLDDTTQSVVSRLNANDFAILLPYVDGKEVEKVAMNILRVSSKVQLPDYVDANAICHIGADMFSTNDTSFQILAEADMALRAAQLHGPSGWFMYDSGQLPQSEVKGSVRWRTTLENAIEKQLFKLSFQPVVVESDRIHHHEVLVRMLDESNDFISAKVFLPMARKCGLIPKVDMQVLELLADSLHARDNLSISVNIHIDSWQNRDFCNWLIKYLKRNADIAQQIIFEVSEFELAQHAKKLSNIFAAIKRYKANIMVDQVGLYVVDTDYLNHLQVDYLKLHQSIVSQIHMRPENQMFLRSLQGVVSERKLTIFALGVESFDEVTTLKRLGVYGLQGMYIKQPLEQVMAANAQVEFDGDRSTL